MGRYVYVLMAALVCLPIHATETSSAMKLSFYDSCVPSCMEKQKQLPENKALFDVPFVLTAYCSCHCSRMSMRISNEAVQQMIRAGASGKGPESIPEVVSITKRNMTICAEAIVKP